MAICYGIKVMVCDECGKRWLPESENLPVQCPNRDCRSRKWNKSGKVYDAPEPAIMAAQVPSNLQPLAQAPPVSPASLMASLRAVVAHLEQPVEDDEPTLPMCAYTEYEPESGETYQCGLRQHSFKVKHTRGARI